MKTKLLILLGIFLLMGFSSFAQIIQTIRGTVVDKESQFPLIGVNVSITSISDIQMGASSDLDGTFRIDGVPIGRHDMLISYLGYGDVILSDIIVNSAKEIIINVQMEEAFTKLEEVTIVAKRSGEVANEVATVSAREFSVKETNRYAGSRGEPARMASNFAGVQGADDSRNDIVVRGNSPSGVLWRLEGVNIPNPNHFATPGTGGGSVTILNNKFLANSDFFTGAFPAEYGNSIAGVFDLKMRNGNNEKHEFSAQLGLLGLELSAEGPLSKNSKASYLAMYRYSTLAAFQFLNINVGTDAIPFYQDAAFRLNFPLKGGANLAFFGIGGDSHIDIILNDKLVNRCDTADNEQDIYAASSRDQYFGTRTGVIGMNYTKPLNKSMYVKGTLSASHYNVFGIHDLIERQWEPSESCDSNFVFKKLHPILDYEYTENKYSAYLFLNKKFNRKLSMKAGINYDLNQVSYIDSAKSFMEGMNYANGEIKLDEWRVRWDSKDFYSMVQPYVQFKFKASEKLTLTGGLNMLYSDISENTFSPLEPRLGLSYQIDDKQKISFGTGLHSQLLYPYAMYYSNDTDNLGDPQEYNLDLGFTKSIHAVAAYDRLIGNNMRMKAEVYYQHLYDIPVDEVNINSYSIINEGGGYGFLHPQPLKNAGLGRNYGFEMTLEKFFSKGYYFLVTGSLFDAKYQGTDEVWRNTTYNGRFAANALFAKEWTFNNKSALNIGGKFTTVGGRWFGEVDDPCSNEQLEPCYIDETVNTKQYRPYLRLDAKISYRINSKNFAHEIAFDLVNVTARKNILSLTYEPGQSGKGSVVEQYQLGLFPIFYYKIDF